MKKLMFILSIILLVGILVGCVGQPIEKIISEKYSLVSVDGGIKEYSANGHRIHVTQQIMDLKRPLEKTDIKVYRDLNYTKPLVLVYQDRTILIDVLDSRRSLIKVMPHRRAYNKYDNLFVNYWGPGYIGRTPGYVELDIDLDRRKKYKRSSSKFYSRSKIYRKSIRSKSSSVRTGGLGGRGGK